jgi:iron complex outermembrane receptor protein
MSHQWQQALAMSGLTMSGLMVTGLAQAAEERALEEIIVTAQKREERLIEVPMSVTAISGAELAQRGVQSIQDLSFVVPGLTSRVDGPGSQQIFLRGISNLSGSDAQVSVYLDESPVTLNRFRQIDLRALDIERIEVLKGPQGTLYGQGALAGTVRFVSAKPQLDRLEGRIEADFSYIEDGDSNPKLVGVANVPLVKDTFAVRVAATAEEGGGWIDQPEAGIEDGNDQDLYNIRTQALWRLGDALDLNATVAVYRLESELGLDWEKADRTNNVPTDRARRLRPRIDAYELYNLTGTYDFGSASLISATTYIDQRRDYTIGFVGSPVTFINGLEGTDTIDDRSDVFSQEVRLVSSGDGPFNYTVGVFYRDIESRLVDAFDVRLPSGFLIRGVTGDVGTSESVSVFVDASYAVTDRLTLGAGVRYFEDERSLFESNVLQSETFDSTDPRVYASFALSDAWRLYANVAKGFRSGGFNDVPFAPFEPEELISYEIGTKGATANGALQFELSVYFTEYEDMLRNNQVLNPQGTDVDVVTSNIGTVEIKGIEGSVVWRATQALRLSATAAFIDGEVKELTNLDSVNRPGDAADYVPEVSYTVASDYDFDLGASVSGFAHVDYNYRDEVTFTDRFLYVSGQEVQRSESFGLLGARIGLRWDGRTVELYGTNLTNTNRLIDPFDAFSQANRTKPRTVGMRAVFNF